jgi:hypothetical protein
MKPRPTVSYFPVSAAEQRLLLRIRETDLVGRAEEVAALLDRIGEARLTLPELDLAITLLAQHRQGAGLEARVVAIESRLGALEPRRLDLLERGLLALRAEWAAWVMDRPSPVSWAGSTAATTQEHDSARSDEVPEQATIAFRVGTDVVWGETASDFYAAVWRWLGERGRVGRDQLPILTGKKRYAAATTPFHPTGNPFTRPVQPVDGIFVEVNLSRADILRRAKKYLDQFGARYVVLVGDE